LVVKEGTVKNTENGVVDLDELQLILESPWKQKPKKSVMSNLEGSPKPFGKPS